MQAGVRFWRLFLSTPSARRATGAGAEPLQCCRYFYPRPPRGGRRRAFLQGRLPVYFYPRPPRGGRLHPGISPCCTPKFLSTPSARRATHHPAQTQSAPHISIHALREEGDPSKLLCMCHLLRISIHALREEGDQGGATTPSGSQDFYPRPPRGGRPLDSWHYGDNYAISIHALREEGDSKLLCMCHLLRISIHALREEGDPPQCCLLLLFFYFYPRPPRGGRQQKQRQNLYFQTNYTTFCTNLEEP